jgi:hypothetical protein
LSVKLVPKSRSAILNTLREQWLDAWPEALEAWSKFTRIRPPTLCLSDAEAVREGLTGSFAMIRLQDQAIVVNLPDVISCRLEAFAVEILAHEVGHHVLAPANLTDHTRMIAGMRWALPTVEHFAPMVANLYTDLLINDRLQRSANLRLADVYRQLSLDKAAAAHGAVWSLYMRVYEILWSLERGSLQGGKTDDHLEGDAWLGARLIRSYARDWLDGSGRFAALFLPHLLQDTTSTDLVKVWLDTKKASEGGEPAGLVEADAEERDGAIHPAQDPELADVAEGGEDGDERQALPQETKQNETSQGQAREPFEYGEILRSAGVNLTDHEMAVRYYRERALPHLIPFPSRPSPQRIDPLPEGLEPWDIGHPLDDVDWLQSILQSPRVIPGVTTVQRVWGTSPGSIPELTPLDLDLYVDSSGSMPNPQVQTSYPALAGAIVCLSALRAGARVKATLWSGKHQVTETAGFVRDEEAILRVLTGFYGGGTAFPIHSLRDTYKGRPADARPAHILVISDDGISTLFDPDEQGGSGWEVSAMALRAAAGGGTLVLNLPPQWEENTWAAFTAIRMARDEQGWQVCPVTTWEELVSFAREFSRRQYGSTVNPQAAT